MRTTKISLGENCGGDIWALHEMHLSWGKAAKHKWKCLVSVLCTGMQDEGYVSEMRQYDTPEVPRSPMDMHQ